MVCDGKADIASHDKRIKVYETKPTNQYGNLQRFVGISKATKRYMLFLDDDDFLTENALTDIKVSLEKHNRPDILIGKTFGQYGYMPHEPFIRPQAGSISGSNIIVRTKIAQKVQWPHNLNGTLMNSRYGDFRFVNGCWYETEKTFYDKNLVLQISPRYSFGA